MKVKSVVKVMNFHSLLRVDSSKKRAEKFFEYEKELTNFVDNILNNKNLILDKKMLKLNPGGRPLNIYIANDLGFCGDFNSNVSTQLKNDKECDKIIIGKKIISNDKNVILAMTKEDYINNINKIENILLENIKKQKYSEVNIIYNHYYNISKIEFIKKRLLPLENGVIENKQNNSYKEDFVVEGNINEILANIIVLYLSYEIKIATENSYASENIQRQILTKESLKKIEEIEEKEKQEQIKDFKMKNFKKLLDSIIKSNKD